LLESQEYLFHNRNNPRMVTLVDRCLVECSCCVQPLNHYNGVLPRVKLVTFLSLLVSPYQRAEGRVHSSTRLQPYQRMYLDSLYQLWRYDAAIPVCPSIMVCSNRSSHNPSQGAVVVHLKIGSRRGKGFHFRQERSVHLVVS
jgi:hypothetical protein